VIASRPENWFLAMLPITSLVMAGCENAHAPASVSQPATATSAQAPVATASSGSASSDVAPADDAPSATKEVVQAAPQNITFDSLKFALEKNADYEPSLLTPDIQALHGRAVRLRGYILPSFQQTGLTQFVLVRDNMQCCFGPGAALYDCVVVEMKPGKSTDFTVRPVAVEGNFELRNFLGPDGKYLAIYHLDGDAVRF
jgi:hypothetical protein